MAKNENIRVFIAIPIKDSVNQVIPILNKLKFEIPGNVVKWVEPENLHLTLKFLGESDLTKINEIYQVLNQEITPLPKIDATLTKLGAFPNLKNPNTIWLSIEPEKAFSPLAKKIDVICANLGFPLESRPFSAHITLGRVKRDLTDKSLISCVLKKHKEISPINFSSNQIIIYKSVLQRSGPVYMPLHILK